ncbi:major tail protein [Mycobacterium phage Rockstar]|uniref:Major tail protein n=2 Tax=Veracruzvirus rockstar TaxID=2003502 RepID=A0A6M3T3M9_9CAUD|nr:tail protein [Mycobacterium phage Rockstar]QJD51998.1 major tail protein [Mycobacterium phage MK4]QJD52158.1 major tail protein [Mycobacterium phage JF4]QJD52237.1 major tail protein [Mycobacterium phage JF2]BBC53741.1 putative major tail protein [Mycobacterium phage B1]AEK07388.1 major tail protein [Mycobacterium phage Rockstar]
MALNDNAVLTAAVGYVYTAPVGTAAPTASALDTINLADTSTWGAGLTVWDSVGHTSRGDMPEFGFDGGDTEVRGTWQKKKLKEVTTEDPVDYLLIYLHQFDEDALALYYGPNASSTPGEFAVSGSADPTEKAFFVVIEDGDVRIGFHAAKASVRRDDAIQLPVDEFASLPVRATFLNHNSEPLFKWINEDLFPNAGSGGGGED